MGNTKEYNRKYAKAHRGEILEERKTRYWTDPKYRKKLLDRTRDARTKNKVLEIRKRDMSLPGEESRLIVKGDKSIKLFNKAVFARFLGITRVTIDNWHKSGILPPTDIDELGRFWYREDYMNKVSDAIGRFKSKMRKEVLARRIREVFSGAVYEKNKS